MRHRLMILIAALTACLTTNATHAAVIGTTAEFTNFFHGISGTVTVIDEDTFRVDNFTYDGQGPVVYFYLGFREDDPSFTTGLEIPTLLSGTVFDGTQGPLFYDLPSGETFGAYNAISVWCAQFGVNFGSGTFTPIQGDLDGDGFVGINDLGHVLGNWNESVPPADPLGDPSGDGFVGIDDLNIVLSNWNVGTPPTGTAATVPEPTATATLALLALLSARQPRKH